MSKRFELNFVEEFKRQLEKRNNSQPIQAHIPRRYEKRPISVPKYYQSGRKRPKV